MKVMLRKMSSFPNSQRMTRLERLCIKQSYFWSNFYFLVFFSANGFESWPGEDFALFSPLGGCPSGLQEDVVGHRANKYFTSDSYHLATKLEDNVFSSKICKHKKTGGRGQTNTVKPMTMWEPGHYCIMKNGRKCPKGNYIVKRKHKHFTYLQNDRKCFSHV